MSSKKSEIRVWDPVVRVFHWSLVVFFVVAYLSAEVLLPLHVYSGYGVLGLIVVRLAWGVIGTRHARFSDFVRPPHMVLDYLKDVLRLRARRYIGHNPAGGAMIVLMLAALLVTSLTGLAVYGIEGEGPLAVLLAGVGEAGEDMLEEVHEFFANFTVLLIIIHVAGVLAESLLHGENLVKAMWTGRKHA